MAISVSAEGRGLPAYLSPRLFKKFSCVYGWYRGGGIDGTGMESAICKGILEAHGGRIRPESNGPGLGARFAFTLLAVEAGAVVGPVESSPFETARRRRKWCEFLQWAMTLRHSDVFESYCQGTATRLQLQESQRTYLTAWYRGNPAWWCCLGKTALM